MKIEEAFTYIFLNLFDNMMYKKFGYSDDYGKFYRSDLPCIYECGLNEKYKSLTNFKYYIKINYKGGVQ